MAYKTIPLDIIEQIVREKHDKLALDIELALKYKLHRHTIAHIIAKYPWRFWEKQQVVTVWKERLTPDKRIKSLATDMEKIFELGTGKILDIMESGAPLDIDKLIKVVNMASSHMAKNGISKEDQPQDRTAIMQMFKETLNGKANIN